ncbi:hypothetical protein ELQ35_14510 [Peribacillus cavernae]|uniref:SPOR domain-containing protein n=1 Tax=Peribacillus cavernae TaxID=1674310 RepID=A0A433HHF4_9BACI|nr:hypothetical protein [Peribacillus cavernae]MDQ0219377.1 stage II sporulation protein B [Peribacillus cavernae]RUQ27747.1 hypothetical protein ELQ35_14510 [Peribacillus cavernae]
MKSKGACEMDKSKNQKGLTIKINGQEKSFEETKKDRFHPESQVAAASEKEKEESFDWMLPDEAATKGAIGPAPVKKGKAAIYSFGGKSKSKGQKDGTGVLKAFLIAIICAIILGTFLGFIILKTITSDDGTQASGENQNVASAPAEKPAATAESNKNTSLSPLKVYLVQGGVFSTESSASKIQKSIKQKGVPAEIFKLDGRFYIFLGSAGSLQESKELASYFQSNQLDAFWKEVSLSAAIKGDGKESKLLSDMSALYSTLAQSTSSLLLSPETAIDEKRLEKQLKTVNETAKGVSVKPLAALKKNVSSASELLNKYQTSKDPRQLLQAQDQLLAFLKGYQSMG